MSRPLRVVSTLVVLALAFTYVLLKIDVHETARIIRSADPLWVALSVVLIFVMILPCRGAGSNFCAPGESARASPG